MASTNKKPSVLDLCLFHNLERKLFGRLTGRLAQEPERTKKVIALWLWFESIGHYDFIRRVNSFDDEVILQIFAEAMALLDCLFSNQDTGGGKNNEIPFTNSLMIEPKNLQFFGYRHVDAYHGVRYIWENICQIIFKDNIMPIAASWNANHPSYRRVISSTGLKIRPFGEGTSHQQSAILGAPRFREAAPSIAPPAVAVIAGGWQSNAPPVPVVQSTLNPMSRPWLPGVDLSSEVQRTMFITFSKGDCPLSREEIKEFFDSYWGPCVEEVMIQRAPTGVQPLYGRVVFTSISMVAILLNGQEKAKFFIRGRKLWARMHVPRQN